MKQNIRISVIVPIYNVEIYLRQCIESIINQTYKEIEIILVDDGSPDNSPKICDEYKNKDERIIVIHKQNGGLVSARKAGLKIATGDYILNVDGDDFIESDLIEKMIHHLEKNDADVVITGYKTDSVENVKKMSNETISGIYTGNKLKELKENIFYSGKFYSAMVIPAVWNKLMRRSLLMQFQMNVPDEIKMGEDIAVTYPFILNTNCVIVDNEITSYHYRFVENSMSRKFDPKYFERLKYLFDYLESYFINNNSIKYYYLFILLIGVNSYLFNGKRNILLKNRQLKKILKIFNINSEYFNDLCFDSFEKNVINFVYSLKRNNFFTYIICGYINAFNYKIKKLVGWK